MNHLYLFLQCHVGFICIFGLYLLGFEANATKEQEFSYLCQESDHVE
jgi:hypothetical protein